MAAIGKDAQLEAAAEKTLAALRSSLTFAMSANALSPSAIADLLTPGSNSAWDFLSGDNSQDRMRMIAQNINRDSGYIDDLAGRRRVWAENGQRADGSRYTWEQWRDFANVVGSDLATQSGAAWDSGIFGFIAPNVPEDTLAAISVAEDEWDKIAPNLPDAATIGKWILWGGIAVAVVYLFGPALRNIGGKVTA